MPEDHTEDIIDLGVFEFTMSKSDKDTDTEKIMVVSNTLEEAIKALSGQKIISINLVPGTKVWAAANGEATPIGGEPTLKSLVRKVFS